MQTSESIVPEERVLTPGRRTFLKAGLAIGAVALLDGWQNIESSAETSGAETPDKNLNSTYNPAVNPLEKLDDHLIENNTLPDTVKDTLPMFGANIGYSLMTNNNIMRLWSGNSGVDEIIRQYRENKMKTLGSLVIKAPLIEEGLFRALPAIVGGTDSLMPIRGLVSTYLFGKVHQLKLVKEPANMNSFNPKPTAKILVDQNKIPVPQYAVGGFLWMLARRRGLKHSVVAHATNNALAAVAIETISHKKKYS